MQLTKLFEPGRIGQLEIKNRLVMAAMGIGAVDMEGYVTERTIEYFERRAQGGIGLIITQACSVVPEARSPYSGSIYNDSYIPGLRKLADAIHAHGAKVACQIIHTGVLLFANWRGFERPPELEIVGPSAVPCATYQVTPRELSREEIHRMVVAFAEGARRVKDAGFDAVEIHGAHGYFLSSFLSPFMNRRTDEYGGSVKNRSRFVCEIIAQIRRKVGADFPLLIRMNGSDFLEGGLTVDEAKQLAALFVEAGVDAVDISAATQDSRQWRDLGYLYPDGAIVHLAEAIKSAVKVPVITVGKIGDPVLADNIVREGKADFVAMARALLADPELPNKAREGRLEDIRRCLYCNNCRVRRPDRLSKEQGKTEIRRSPLKCTVNPALLREREFALTPASKRKKVMVVGGGLAGMEAAVTLAERGHQVSLYERSGELGGQWVIASKCPSKGAFGTLSRYLTRRLREVQVDVKLNKDVNRRFAEEQKPDAIVVATGATSMTLPVPGADGENVVQAVDVFAGKASVGDRVVVIGARLRGMEVANFLADQGKEVSVVTKNRLGENGTPLERNTFVTLRDRLIERRVMIVAQAPVFEIRRNGVYVVDNNELLFLPADTVVLAVGTKSESRLATDLQGIAPELHSIGDCVEPSDALAAMHDGAEVGRTI